MAAPSAKWLGEAVYGLPEIYADKIKDARIVANPGCLCDERDSGVAAAHSMRLGGHEQRGGMRLQIGSERRGQGNCGAICNSWKWMKISKPTIFFRTGTRRKFWTIRAR